MTLSPINQFHRNLIELNKKPSQRNKEAVRISAKAVITEARSRTEEVDRNLFKQFQQIFLEIDGKGKFKGFLRAGKTKQFAFQAIKTMHNTLLKPGQTWNSILLDMVNHAHISRSKAIALEKEIDSRYVLRADPSQIATIRIPCKDGSVYLEDILAGQRTHNVRIENSKKQRQYEGQWFNGQPNGKGILFNDDKYNRRHYEGDFLNGEFHGKGTLFYNEELNGPCYEGNFVSGERHENGILPENFENNDVVKYQASEPLDVEKIAALARRHSVLDVDWNVFSDHLREIQKLHPSDSFLIKFEHLNINVHKENPSNFEDSLPLFTVRNNEIDNESIIKFYYAGEESLSHIFYPNQFSKCSVEKNTLSHFRLSQWKVLKEGPAFESGEPKYVVDELTKEKYLNESKLTIAIKLLGTFLVSITGIVYLLASLGYLMTHLKQLDFGSVGIDLLRILFLPLVLSAFILATFISVYNLLDARKIYATLERVIFCGHRVIAPCFQPNPTTHLFGASMKQQNGF